MGGGGLSPQDCAVITGLRLHGTSQEWCQLGSPLFANSRGSKLTHKEVRLIPRYGPQRDEDDTTKCSQVALQLIFRPMPVRVHL